MSEELDDFLRRRQSEAQGKARVMVETVKGVSPEEAVRRAKYRRTYGIDAPGKDVLDDFPDLKNLLDGVDEETRAAMRAAENPKVAAWYARDPNNAAIARGGHENLADISAAVQKARPVGDAFKPFGALGNIAGFGANLIRAGTSGDLSGENVKRSVQAGLADQIMAGGVGGTLQFALETMGFGRDSQALDFVKRRREGYEKLGQVLRPETQTTEGQAILQGFESVPLSVGALAAGVLTGGSATVAAAAIGVPTFGGSYVRAREEGLGYWQSALYGGIDASIEVATERLTYLKALDATAPVMKRIGNTLASESIGEQLATLGQDFNAWANIEVNQGKTFGDFLAERPEAAYQTAIAALVTSGAITSTVEAGNIAARKLGGRMRRAQAAGETQRFAEALGNLTKASTVLQRDRETFEDFVRSAAEGTEVSDVFIAAEQLGEVLDQADLTVDEVFDMFGKTPEQIQTAIERGDDIMIPVEQYAARIAANPLGDSLMPHIRLDPEEMSTREAETFMQGAKEEFAQEVERSAVETEANTQRQTSRAAVEGRILSDLQTARRFTDDVNEVYASIVGAFFDTQAAKVGVSAEELFDRYQLRVQSGEVQDASYTQSQQPLVNIGLDIPTGGTLDPQQVREALTALGVNISAENIAQSDSEQTFIGQLDRALTPDEAFALSEQLGQEAIAQYGEQGGGLFGPQAANWGDFNPEFFLDLTGGRLSQTLDQSAKQGTAQQLAAQVERSKDKKLRGLIDPAGGVFWWDAYEGTHDQKGAELGIEVWPRGRDNRVYAYLEENGAVVIDMGSDAAATVFERLASTDRAELLEFNAFGSRWTSEDFLQELEEYEGPRWSETFDQAPLSETVPGVSHVMAYLNEEERAMLKKRTAERMMDIFTNLPDAEEMASVAYSGRAKRGWYERSAEALITLFGIEDAPRFAALLAALSPQTSVESNTTNALAVWVAWEKAGRPTERSKILKIMGDSVQGGKGLGSVLNAWIDNTMRALTAPNPMQLDLSGPKVNSFFLNLIGVMDEVTNDTWMANYSLMAQSIFAARRVNDPNIRGAKIGVKGPGYLAMNALVRRAAEIATEKTGDSWTPAEIQETVWSWVKALTEKTQGSAMQASEILQAGALTEGDIANTPDFAQLFIAGFYRKFLVDMGYGNEVAALEELDRSARPEGGAGAVTSGEGFALSSERFAEHLANAASRIDQRLNRRREDAQPSLFDPQMTTFNQDGLADPLQAFKRESFYPEIAVRHEDGTVYADVPNWYPDRLQNIADQLGATAVVGVEQGDPRLDQGIRLWHSRPPLNGDGTITLHHWGPAGISETDPTRWGESGTLPTSERQKVGGSLPRTYFGIASGQPGGYIIEFPGATQYETTIAADELYDIMGDPDGLKPAGNDDKLEKKIKAKGYKGYWRAHDQLGLVAVVFEPMAVREANATFDQDGIFYSALERAVEQSTTKKAPAAQWKGTLAKAPGVKQEELEWTGLLDFLDMNEGPIEKDALLELLRDGGIVVEEVLLGAPRAEPAERFNEEKNLYEIYDRNTGEILDEVSIQDLGLGSLDGYAVYRAPKFQSWSNAQGDQSYRELLIRLPKGVGRNPTRSPDTHWDQEDVVAHIRFYEGQDADGTTTLVIDEIQSDWHQKGRDQGYEQTVNPEELAAAQRDLEAANKAADEVRQQIFALTPAETMGADGNETQRFRELNAEFERLSLQASEASQRFNNLNRPTGIPNAPFRSSWPELTMKRMIRWAADNGYTKIAWTPGQQHADRYNLSQSVGAIAAREADPINGEQAYTVALSNDRAQFTITENYDVQTNGRGLLTLTGPQLREIFGENIAKQIIDGVGDGTGSVNLQGEDLRVGGEGMKAFYDRNLVNITNKLIKKHGAKVGVVGVNSKDKQAEIRDEVQQYTREQMRDRDRINALRTALTNPEVAANEELKAEYEQDIQDRLAQFERTNERIAELEAQDATEPHWGFDVTESLSEAARGGFPLFQKNGKKRPPRAQIRMNLADVSSMESTITLLRGADLSSFVHELGHFFFEVTNHMAAQPGAPQGVIDDRDAIMRYAGVESITDWQNLTPNQRKAAHEKLATSFELYLFEGRAPSLELRGVFNKLRSWMLQVYRTITNAHFKRWGAVELSDEVRSVFDRMLASEDAIREAEADLELAPQFTDKPDGMSDAEWGEYQQLNDEARTEAAQRLERRSLQDLKYAGKAVAKEIKRIQRQVADQRSAMREEVEAEIRSLPVYRAITLFRTGELDGQKIEGEHKLNTELVRELLQLDDAPLPSQFKGLTKKGALNPEQAAELLGWSSADHMLKDLLFADPVNDAIEAETDARMKERYGDLNSPEEVEEAARAAVHNDVRGRMVATELSAMSGAQGRRRALTAAAKRLAGDMVARLRIRDIRPSQYEAAERRAAKAAIETGTTDLDTSVRHKRNQLFQFHAAKAAHEARDEMRKARDYLRKFDNKNTRGAIDPDYLDQIDKLLERYELRMISNREADRRASLAKWIEQQRDMGFEPAFDEETLREIGAKNWRDLTVEEMRGLLDAVRNIEYLGRTTKKLLTAKDKADLDQAAGEMATSVRDNAYKNRDEVVGAKSWWERVVGGARDYFAMHRKVANLAYVFDGNKYGGAFWSRFVQTMNARGDWQAVRNREANERLAKVFKLLGKEDTTKRRYYDFIGRSLSLEDRLMFALNWGNSANRQRLLDGDKLEEQQVMQLLGTLEPQHWDFVEAVWADIDSYWPEIAAKERRVSGIEPLKVEAEPFQIEIDGELRLISGGYFPIKYDPERSSKAEADTAAEIQRQMTQGLYTRATTRRGHTKARAEQVNRPLQKNFSTIFSHVNTVIHDLAWHEYLIDANRLLRHPEVDSAVRDHYGPETLRWIRKALEDIAVGDLPAQNSFEQAINYLRNGVSVAAMGWSVWTSLLQPLGLTQSVARIGAKHVGKGIAELFGSPKAMNEKLAWIYEVSPFMSERSNTMQREINEIRNRIKAKSPLRKQFDKVVPQGITSAVGDSYFYMLVKAQLMADVPTWLGQYHKSLDAGVAQDDAVAQADQAVLDSQSGGQIKDLAGIQRGSPLMRLWTNFYSYFAATFNLTVDRTAELRRVGPSDLPYYAVDIMLLTVVPATLSSVMYGLLRGGWDDDDDMEDIAKSLAADNVSYMLGMMIGMRELGAAFTGNAGYSGPAGARAFAELNRFAKQVSQGEADEALARSANQAGGILLHYPASQLDRTVRGSVAAAKGETGPQAVLMGPPPQN